MTTSEYSWTNPITLHISHSVHGEVRGGLHNVRRGCCIIADWYVKWPLIGHNSTFFALHPNYIGASEYSNVVECYSMPIKCKNCVINPWMYCAVMWATERLTNQRPRRRGLSQELANLWTLKKNMSLDERLQWRTICCTQRRGICIQS